MAARIASSTAVAVHPGYSASHGLSNLLVANCPGRSPLPGESWSIDFRQNAPILKDHDQGNRVMYEASTIIGTCIDCIAPGSLAATLSVIAIGVALAVQSERRKLVPVKSRSYREARTAQSRVNFQQTP